MAIIIFSPFFFFLRYVLDIFTQLHLLYTMYTMYSGCGQINCVAIIWPCISLGHWTLSFFPHFATCISSKFVMVFVFFGIYSICCFPVEWVQAKQSTNSWIRWNGWICMEWIFILCWCVLALTWKFIMMYQNFSLIW